MVDHNDGTLTGPVAENGSHPGSRRRHRSGNLWAIQAFVDGHNANRTPQLACPRPRGLVCCRRAHPAFRHCRYPMVIGRERVRYSTIGSGCWRSRRGCCPPCCSPVIRDEGAVRQMIVQARPSLTPRISAQRWAVGRKGARLPFRGGALLDLGLFHRTLIDINVAVSDLQHIS